MKYKCCLCHKDFTGLGNNPYPLIDDDNARCCDECNKKVVMFRLIKMMYKEGK